MASDMAVALPRTTTDGRTWFGHGGGGCGGLVHLPRREHAPDEVVPTTRVRLPQARQTWAVLGGRAGGSWGLCHGLNEKGVAVGWTAVRTRLAADEPGLTGPDLVRLGLERGGSARHAGELLTELIGRHGQGSSAVDPDQADAAVLIADAQEACLLEASGRHWALALVGSVRAVTAACVLRQDWDRISRGLADLAIRRGWWPEDGCKLDFAQAVGLRGPDHAGEVRRWGQATLRLEQHSGQIDAAFLRRLLRDRPDGGAALLARVGTDAVPVAWCAVGVAGSAVWMPVFPVADLPPAYGDLGRLAAGAEARPALAGLQREIDTFTAEFLPEADGLQRAGRTDELRRLAGSFAQHLCERLEAELQQPRRAEAAPVEAVVMQGADF